ncbi:MAG: YfgM family protein [Escherichia sp.]
MELYNNENDQVDALKRFFAENGKALAVGVILGVGALVGWRYWTSHQLDTARGSSLAYENAISALKADKPEALNAAQKFAADSKNTYGAFASLELAQRLLRKTIANAEKQLQQGLPLSDNLKSVINMRLARVQLQLKQPDAALKTLDAVKGEGWTAIIADLRGEILLSKAISRAKAAWEAGAKAMLAGARKMRMKINNLSI